MSADVINRIAEGKIVEAIEEGKFDDLPGKGKPLVFDEDPTIPLDVRLTNKVLKNAGVVPEWMQFRTDIVEERKAVGGFLSRIARENARWTAKLESGSYASNHPYVNAYREWHTAARARYLAMLKGVNTSILKFCVQAPSAASASCSFASYRLETEMSRFDEEVPICR